MGSLAGNISFISIFLQDGQKKNHSLFAVCHRPLKTVSM